MPKPSKQQVVAQRTVFCTHCGKSSEVGQRAMSVFCPHCRKRLILEDFKVTSYHAVREFATCGDVVIEKRGHVAARIKAENLVIKGKVKGDVVVRHGVDLHKSAVVQGDIIAPVIHIAEGAQISGFLKIGLNSDAE